MTRPSSELVAYLEEPDMALPVGAKIAPDTEPDFPAWAWGLSRWGQETMVQATLAAAKFALPAWENHEPSDQYDREVFGGPRLREALKVLEALFRRTLC